MHSLCLQEALEMSDSIEYLGKEQRTSVSILGEQEKGRRFECKQCAVFIHQLKVFALQYWRQRRNTFIDQDWDF